MGENSGIAWTHNTFNGWWGCTKVSPACDNCYAESWDARFAGDNPHWGNKAPRRFFADKHWNEPIKWNKRATESGARVRVFCSSMSDVFEGDRDDLEPERQKLWATIRKTPMLDWLLLTKRPQNIKRMLPADLVGAFNIWLGTTIESGDYLWRAEKIRQTKAVVHFLSMEPLLAETHCGDLLGGPEIDGHMINWLITGCESGEKARHTPTDWYRMLRDECRMHGVPYFLKQAPRGADGITAGDGSWTKLAAPARHADGLIKHGIIEQPYLDGAQHIAIPQPKKESDK